MAAQRVPGLALGIVEDGRIAYIRGFGKADDSGRAVTPQTPFIIGSVAKSFTALAIMQLVEANKIDLDAPVQRYLPWFRVADEKASAEITVRNLLNHTSGISTKTGRSYQGNGDTSDTALEQAVRKLNSAALTAPVGSKHQYSTINYSVLGLIVQTVAGQSYESYVQAKILDPLQMPNSFTSEAPARRAGLATGYNYWFGRPRAADLPYNRGLVPAGYLIASAEDMTHYLIAQLNGGRYRGTSVLSSAGISELHQPAVQTPKEGTAYGMGWFVCLLNDIPVDPPSGRDFHFPRERCADSAEPKGSRSPDECGELPRPLHRRSYGNHRGRSPVCSKGKSHRLRRRTSPSSSSTRHCLRCSCCKPAASSGRSPRCDAGASDGAGSARGGASPPRWC